MTTTSAVPVATMSATREAKARGAFRARSLIPIVYIIFLLLPIYWLLNMSFKTTNEILRGFTLWPNDFTLANY
jgi:glycerol transport system permease protein